MDIMLIIAVVLYTMLSVEGSEHILRLQEGVHAATTLIGVEDGSSVLIRCEHPTGNVAKLRWLHGGSALAENHVKTKSDASYMQINNFDKDLDIGVYECSAPGMSASYRLKSEMQHKLPDGFRYCFGEELANCQHADVCQIELKTKLTSCVCEQGWTGEACNVIDTVRSHSIVNPKDCSYWPTILTGIAFFVLMGLFILCVYNFRVRNPHKKALFRNRHYNRPTNLPMVSGDYKPIVQKLDGSSRKVSDVGDIV